jgi:hypothetical protein
MRSGRLGCGKEAAGRVVPSRREPRIEGFKAVRVEYAQARNLPGAANRDKENHAANNAVRQ